MCLAVFIAGYLCILCNFPCGIRTKQYEEEQMDVVPFGDLDKKVNAVAISST